MIVTVKTVAKLISMINIGEWVSEGEPRERWMLCWCLNLWKSTNNGYIPNCFSFIKLRPIVSLSISVHNSRWCHTYFEKNSSSKPSTWNGWHNSWLHGFHQDHWTQIHQCPGRRWREGDRKIKLTVFIMWLCSFAIEDIYSKGHVLGQRKQKKSFFVFSFLFPSLFSLSLAIQWSNHSEIILLIFRSFCAPIILRVIYINQ